MLYKEKMMENIDFTVENSYETRKKQVFLFINILPLLRRTDVNRFFIAMFTTLH